MSLLFHGDCLEEMKNLDDNSVDLIFCDLPYGQISCEWDKKINLNDFWIQIMRIKKINTPIFFTTTTKFGVDLITSAPKKCPFRYDLVWIKSSPAGFLSAKKMPMRKHEMIYVFYEKLPLYDLSSHTHKFIKEEQRKINPKNSNKGGLYSKINRLEDVKYDPPLPVSVVSEEKTQISKPKNKDLYGDMKGGTIGNVHGTNYEPPLPVSVVKEQDNNKDFSVEVNNSTYGTLQIKQPITSGPRWEPPLPVSVVKEPEPEPEGEEGQMVKDFTPNKNGNIYNCPDNQEFAGRNGAPRYDPPLPTTTLEIKSTRGKHSTEKPIELMKWILKYYSKEGDVVLDPTMGSGSTGVSCKQMNRNFIGIEKDPEIYEVAVNRIEG